MTTVFVQGSLFQPTSKTNFKLFPNGYITYINYHFLRTSISYQTQKIFTISCLLTICLALFPFAQIIQHVYFFIYTPNFISFFQILFCSRLFLRSRFSPFFYDSYYKNKPLTVFYFTFTFSKRTFIFLCNSLHVFS